MGRPPTMDELMERMGITPYMKGSRSAARCAVYSDLKHGRMVRDEEGRLTVVESRLAYVCERRVESSRSRVRRHLLEHGPSTVREIADGTCLEPATVRKRLREIGAREDVRAAGIQSKASVWSLDDVDGEEEG